MKSGVFGSFVSYFIVGAFTVWGLDLRLDPRLQLYIKLMIVTSAFYYYYLNLATNWYFNDSKKIIFLNLFDKYSKRKKIIAWLLGAGQYIAFSLMWFTLGKNYIAYGLLHVCVNLSYLIWDYMYWDIVKGNNAMKVMFWFDLAGFVFATLFFWTGHNLPVFSQTYNSTQVGQYTDATIWCGALILQSVIGLIVAIYNWSIKDEFRPHKLVGPDGSQI